MKTQKDKDQRRKQQRRRKVRHLRNQIAGAKDPKERTRLIAKLQQISPQAPIPGS